MARKVEIIPHLAFDGNCEEAINAYIEAFGGEIYFMSRWSEDTFDVTPEQIGKVMHVKFVLGNTRMTGGEIWMHKDSKWANKIILLQEEDGKWGWFHSLSQFYNAPITTEQALRRLDCLGYTIEDECIQKAVSYMNDCLIGKKTIPDRREKVHDWDIFTSLILATWIRRFTLDNSKANKIAKQWADVISCPFDPRETVYCYIW